MHKGKTLKAWRKKGDNCIKVGMKCLKLKIDRLAQYMVILNGSKYLLVLQRTKKIRDPELKHNILRSLIS